MSGSRDNRDDCPHGTDATLRAMLARFMTLFVLLAPTLSAQDPPAAEPVNPAVVPMPRGADWMKRQDKIVADVKAHAGACDLVFVGDSITQGWEGEGKEIWAQRYDQRHAVNLGISGDRTEHVLWRLEHDNLTGIAPKVAVVMIGTNNFGQKPGHSPEQVLEGVRAVVTSIRQKSPTTKVLLLGIFPRGEKFNEMRGNILQVNQALSRLQDDEHVWFLDIGRVFLEDDGTIRKSIMPDFLHLSAEGYRRWADAIEGTLAKLLGG